MNIYCFPTLPNLLNGYSLAVKTDYERLKPSGNDFVVWANADAEKIYEGLSGIFIPTDKKVSTKRFVNVLRNRLSCEIDDNDLKNVVFPQNVDFIFCGNVHFYRLLRAQYPGKHITVRFHNCYSRIIDRMRLLNYRTKHLNFRINLRANYVLEREIMNDPLVYKIFISEEDRHYYVSMFGCHSDSEVWGMKPNMELAIKSRPQNRNISKILWLGGVEPHKKDSVEWFIKKVFYKLHETYPNLEFHLWGTRTKDFDEPTNNIFGHGRYESDDFPDIDTALYINPDIIGGGVKVKLMSYLENGATTLSTPFGFEGYSKDLIDNDYCYVKSMDEWFDFLKSYFSTK